MPDAITRELHLDLTPEDAWPAISDAAWLREWLAEEVELTPTPGGAASFLVDGERRDGWVEEVHPPSGGGPGRLVFWWQADAAPASRVVLELSPTERGACLRVSETRPLELIDLVGIPVGGLGGESFGPALLVG